MCICGSVIEPLIVPATRVVVWSANNEKEITWKNVGGPEGNPQSEYYEGESKIIRTIGTCFVVGYTAGWSWQNTHGLLLSYNCGAGVTLIVYFCHEFFCHKHGHTQFHLHQRRAEGSDPFLWAEGVPGVEVHRMMSVQYGNSVMS